MPAVEAGQLFVYGTLRRGGRNDIARIAPTARFVSFARLRGRLYDVNGRWPSLVLDAAVASMDVTLYTANPVTTSLTRLIASGDWLAYARILALGT